MNTIKEASEQFYPFPDSLKLFAEYERCTEEYITHVTHYEAYRKQRGFEMVKVEGEEDEVADEYYSEQNRAYENGDFNQYPTLRAGFIDGFAIGEARGRDKWIRVEDALPVKSGTYETEDTNYNGVFVRELRYDSYNQSWYDESADCHHPQKWKLSPPKTQPK